MKKKRAVLAGEFDPITDFDYSIIQRCSLVFDEVVLLLVNNDRHAFFLSGEYPSLSGRRKDPGSALRRQ